MDKKPIIRVTNWGDFLMIWTMVILVMVVADSNRIALGIITFLLCSIIDHLPMRHKE